MMKEKHCECPCGQLINSPYARTRFIKGHNKRSRLDIVDGQKQCGHCGEFKDLSEFGKQTRAATGYRSECNLCRSTNARVYYEALPESVKEKRFARQKQMVEERRQFVQNYFHPYACGDCGETDPVVLEHDHVRGVKEGNISHMIGSAVSLEKIAKELAKCEVVCANCHRRRTAKRLQDKVQIQWH